MRMVVTGFLRSLTLLFLCLAGFQPARSAPPQYPFVTVKAAKQVSTNSYWGKEIVQSPSGRFYVLNRERKTVEIYDANWKFSKQVSAFMSSTDALAVDASGRIYLADASTDQVRILDVNGQISGKFQVSPQPTSLAVLSNGTVVTASPENGSVLHLYDASGNKLKDVGQTKLLFNDDIMENEFLNQGKVLVDASDTLYFISTFSLSPKIQKYSKTGALLAEFPIEGNAIDLQLAAAKSLLGSRPAHEVGGIRVINSASIDPATGHLWVSVNGSSRCGVVYEYTPDGQKLREYAFSVEGSSSFSGVLPGVQHIFVKGPSASLFTMFGAYQVNLTEIATLPRTVPAQNACPPAQTNWSCSVTCRLSNTTVDRDCKKALLDTVNTTQAIIVAHTCMVNSEGCSASATTCSADGTLVVHETSISCRPRGER